MNSYNASLMYDYIHIPTEPWYIDVKQKERKEKKKTHRHFFITNIPVSYLFSDEWEQYILER